MAQINTKIILRNDTLANWEANGAVVLMKGEAGLAFDTDGSVKVKFGDGVTTWENLGWFSGEIDSAEIENIQDTVDELAAVLGAQADEDTGAAATGIYAEIDRIDGELEDRYTKTETEAAIAAALAGVDHLSYTKVENYDVIDPTAENAHRYIYLVPNAGGEGNAYDEYMVIDGAIEHVGNLSVDLSNYVEKVDGQRMITEDEANKLANLVLNEDGSVGLSGKVAVENVEGLADLLNGYANVIEKVQVGGVDLTPDGDKAVNIPIASADSLGVVKGSANEDEIAVAADGVMSLNAVNVDKLTQDTWVILNGGDSTGSYPPPQL